MVSVGGSAVHESRRGSLSPSTHADTERARVTKETKKARKRTRKDQRSFPFTFCGPSVFDVKYLARYFECISRPL
jgi:hypothetical protein